jgi:hypothetical protein
MTHYLFKSVTILPSTMPCDPLVGVSPPEWVKAGEAEEAQCLTHTTLNRSLWAISALSTLHTTLRILEYAL